jgi:transposase
MMLSLPTAVRIWLATRATDLRKSFDSLAELVRQQLGGDPLSGQLFVFRNQRADRVKLLYWDEDGFVILYKKQEEECPHSFAFTEFGELAHNRALRLA